MSQASELRVEVNQRLTRLGSLGIAWRRWPYSWAERQWGYRPGWWLRLLAAPVVAWQVLRSRTRFPLAQTLRFDDQGVAVQSALGQRRMSWTQFSGWIDLRSSWILTAPGVDLPILHRQLPAEQALRLKALLASKLTQVERPKA